MSKKTFSTSSINLFSSYNKLNRLFLYCMKLFKLHVVFQIQNIVFHDLFFMRVCYILLQLFSSFLEKKDKRSKYIHIQSSSIFFLFSAKRVYINVIISVHATLLSKRCVTQFFFSISKSQLTATLIIVYIYIYGRAPP